MIHLMKIENYQIHFTRNITIIVLLFLFIRLLQKAVHLKQGVTPVTSLCTVQRHSTDGAAGVSEVTYQVGEEEENHHLIYDISVWYYTVQITTQQHVRLLSSCRLAR